MFSEIFGYIGKLAITIISSLGYFGVFFLMVLESMIFPVPSELVMPFAGFLAYQNKMSFWLVVFFSSLGSLTGSLLSYAIGKLGGDRFLLKYGKWFLLDETDLKKTEEWFRKHGEITILFGRMIPVVRHLISIPAGTGKMNLKKFCFYTVLGATAWNTFLAYAGYLLGQNWGQIRHYSEPVSLVVAVILVGLLAYFVYRHIKHRKGK